MFTACEKEENSLINSTPTQNTKEKSNLNHNKSSYEYNIDTMAMAANIETIGASSNGNYSVTLYNNSNTYTVNINAFDEETLIDMDITDPVNGTHNIVIDPQAETISIGNIGDYTFQQYENYVISPSESTIKNIMAIMVVYHAIHPDFSKAFDDNGDEDEFDPNPDPTNPNWIFWGKGNKREIGVNEVMCGPGSVGTMKCWDYYVFWIRIVKDKCGEPECIPPN